MTEIAGLIERVRKLTGPDEIMDGLIAEALSTNPEGTVWEASEPRLARYTVDSPFTHWAAPEYTSSVDAVLGLIEKKLPGWRVGMHQDPGRADWWYASIVSPDYRTKDVPGQGGMERVPVAGKGGWGIQRPTPALALLLALLTALQTGETP